MINDETLANKLDDLLDDGTVKAKPRGRPTIKRPVPKPSGDAKVTISYPASPESLGYEHEIKETENTNGAGTNGFYDNPRSAESSFTQNIPQNRLADMFAELTECQDYDEQQFHCFLVRKPDFANDKFRRRALAAENFQPFPITARSVLDFIPTVQEINGNSGGRFEIRISDENGADTGVGIAGLVISDPIIKDTPVAAQNSETSALIEMIREQQQKSDERFNALLTEMSKPKESELEKALRQKMVNDIINPPSPRESEFKPEQLIQQIFASQAMIATMSDQMAKAFNGNAGKDERSFLEKALENETLMGMVNERVTDFMSAIENLALTYAQSNPSPQVNGQQPVAQSNEGYPPLGAAQSEETPQQTNEAEKETMEQINKIIAVLESEDPITLEHPMVTQLREQEPDAYKRLVESCKAAPLDVILNFIETTLPEGALDMLYNGDGELNERGEKVMKRLETVYELLKNSA